MTPDEMARITADDQAEANQREQRTFATAIAGDVTAYHAALGDAGIGGELRDRLTQDFGSKWHTYRLAPPDVEIDLAALYAEGDDE